MGSKIDIGDIGDCYNSASSPREQLNQGSRVDFGHFHNFGSNVCALCLVANLMPTEFKAELSCLYCHSEAAGCKALHVEEGHPALFYIREHVALNISAS
mmetsp:Transcript_2146/g.3522  ORF Transcript_2146/g.3522 Transcript_2146/m.3522 type:complete len:99 (-) Transcript_2146:21-317(-)